MNNADIQIKGTCLNPRHFIHGGFLLLLALLMAGSSSMLPRMRNEERTVNDGLIPMHSDAAALTRLGIDPVRQPNTTILTHADVVRRFIPSALFVRKDLDPGMMACLEAHDACRGGEINASRILKARTGNFLADFTNFKRRSETTGWRFNALVLMVTGVVVYRAWGGKPNVNEIEVNTIPLGTRQEMGPAIIVNQ